MNFSPKVSIVIPVYNGSNYMGEAIDSALAQTYGNIEVLVINDGSNDNGSTRQIALSYGDNIRYFEKKNGGVASALNLGLKEARGDYLCWLSHDDVYLPEKVAKEMAKLLSLPDKNAVVFCRHSVMDAKGKYLFDAPKPPAFSPGQGAYQLILRPWLHCCTILALKDLYIESGCFREDLPTTQDYDLLVKMGLKHPFIEIPEILLKARSHSEQGCLTPAHLEEVERFLIEHIPLLSEDYMQANFTSPESMDAFLSLGAEMRNRHFSGAVLAVARQLILCEAQRTEPEVLWGAIRQLMIVDYPLSLAKGKTGTIGVYPAAEGYFKAWVRRVVPRKIWWMLSILRRQLLVNRK
ncbi:MAG: glycosyltransferase [Syntrophorhabdaceae bacterium]|nr:glycosyltransferase [Syntrophorhabdaceae bacterium]